MSPFFVEPDGVALQAIAAIIDQGGNSVDVQHVYTLAEVADAHRAGETDRTGAKLVLDLAK